MSIAEAIAQALADADPPPPNESTTCEWIIYPLLLAAGYQRREIVSRIADQNSQFPDYTLLPETPHTWFLEAKAWTSALDERHAQQAINYANQNGRRWVVLTNGAEWRLYDNRVQGTAARKLATCVPLADSAEFRGLLDALSRASVTSGGLAAYADEVRVSAALRAQFVDANSDAVRVVWTALRQVDGLAEVPRPVVACCLAGLVAAPPAPAARAPEPETIRPASSDDTGSAPAPDEGYPLDYLRREAAASVTGSRPSAILIPGAEPAEVNTWAQVAMTVIEWLAARRNLPPLPFGSPRARQTYFLNTKPSHAAGPMRTPRAVTWNGTTLYVELNRSALDILARLCDLCVQVGADPGAIRVTLRPELPIPPPQ
ncbi:MAG: type I restriction enzyme HsdR N-terminal domain-containing protein [Chthonomonadales bacterium]|nr:type I restriction enzyme HsdR N-terminal domain-containing protein [Chthonomonadales bacterium]